MKARLPAGMGGGQNMNAMIRQAQKLQEQLAELEEELNAKEHEISAGGGAVKIKMMGTLEVKSIEIAPEIVDSDDIETLSDILVAAVNEAIKKITDENNAAKEKLTGAMNIPGLM